MHVLITADTIGGVWTYTRELASGLLSHGHRVTLVSFGRLPTSAQTSWMQRKQLNYYPTAFPLEWMQNSHEGITKSAHYLQRIIDDAAPDVLHFNQYCYGALECGIPKIVVAHSDVLSWWNAVEDIPLPQSPWFDWYQATVARGLRCADIVVAPSRRMLDTLYEEYSYPFPARVIYNGRSNGVFRASQQKQNCVLSVGRVWDKAKQIELLLARRQFVPVLIAGSTKHPDKTEDLQESFDSPVFESSSGVQFCGEQSETQLSALYATCAMYAATSRYEPFGLAPVEAALSRCALIVNDIPVFRELWGDAAFYFKRNDAESLTNAIAALAGSAPLRRLFAEHAYERARSCFGSARMVSEYEDLYRALVRGGRTHEYAIAA